MPLSNRASFSHFLCVYLAGVPAFDKTSTENINSKVSTASSSSSRSESSQQQVYVKKNRGNGKYPNKSKSQELQKPKLSFHGIKPSSSQGRPFYSQLTHFLTPAEQDGLNAHYAEWESQSGENGQDSGWCIDYSSMEMGPKEDIDHIYHDVKKEITNVVEGLVTEIILKGTMQAIQFVGHEEESRNENRYTTKVVLSEEQEIDFRIAFELFDMNKDGWIR